MKIIIEYFIRRKSDKIIMEVKRYEIDLVKILENVDTLAGYDIKDKYEITNIKLINLTKED